ncbi:MAG: response regulator [Candidatus Omnitrophota bacterium]
MVYEEASSENIFPRFPLLLISAKKEILNSMHEALESGGINNIEKCQDSRQVLSLLERKTYSLILLELLIPHIRGDALLPKILEKEPAMKVIMLTPPSEFEVVPECKRAGAIDILITPVEKIELTRRVLKGLNLKSPLKKAFIADKRIEDVIRKTNKKLIFSSKGNYKTLTIFLAGLDLISERSDFGQEENNKRNFYHDQLAAKVLKSFDGKIIKNKVIEGSVFAVFDEIPKAVKAAISFRMALEFLEEEIDLPLKSRIVLNCGEVNPISLNNKYKIFDKEINKAEYILKNTPPGKLLATIQTITNAKLSLGENPFIKILDYSEDLVFKIKGIDEPVKVVEISVDEKS